MYKIYNIYYNKNLPQELLRKGWGGCFPDAGAYVPLRLPSECRLKALGGGPQSR